MAAAWAEVRVATWVVVNFSTCEVVKAAIWAVPKPDTPAVDKA